MTDLLLQMYGREEKIKGIYGRVSTEVHQFAQTEGLDIRMLARAVAGYVAIVLNRQADYCNRMTTWHNTGEKLNHLFGRQAIPSSHRK